MDWKLVGGIGLVGLGLVGLRSQSKRAETAELLNAEIDMTIEDKDGVIYWMDKDRVQNYFKNWKKDSYPYEVRVMSERKQKWCENCGELDEDDEDSWEHYQSYLKRKNSTKPAFRFISGGGCHGCGMSLCQKCIEGDTTFNGFEPTCEECGYAFCGDCKDDMEDRCNPCQEEYEDSICDCCGYACGSKNAETSGQWEIGEQLEEAQMNAETFEGIPKSVSILSPLEDVRCDKYEMEVNFENEDIVIVSGEELKAIMDDGWDLDSVRSFEGAGMSLLFTRNPNRAFRAEDKKRKKISGVLSDPFDELSLDSGGIKKWLAVGIIGGLTIFGYKKWK